MNDNEMSKFINEIINDKLASMNSVHRQSTITTIKSENIAQHSFFVAYYALKIAKVLDLSREIQGEITIEALIHDIAESSSSDVPSNVKYQVPGLKQMLDKAEDFAINKYFPEIQSEFDHLREHEANGDIVGTVIKLADIIALIQFLQTERSLGNQDATLIKALNQTYDNLKRHLNKLSEIIK
ncbi:MAG TPA: HD domain-containing protein [Candidatus Ligilactobacillus excrementigallinarum]|uniref:HD domain-containing protein n=1 Tax=Candidatus Ligilactobacillus excrementigallinarum TaxID=2838641 RepID=A0A9D2A9A7_9LACO|nr:HD domain-containing protein [Candidatus Ligilactobacillus excrementigallinarum]